MSSCHIFDVSTLVELDQSCWIVDKSNPSVPIMKVSQADFKLMKSGIYRSHGHKVEFNGHIYWIPDTIFNKLKVKLKLLSSNLDTLGISMQEFLNPRIVEQIKPTILIDNIIHLKNSNDDIYVICAKQTERVFDKVITKLEQELAESGIRIKKIYYTTETFYNQRADIVKFNKTKMILQHLIGYKTEIDKFVDTEVPQYNKVLYYDTNYDTMEIADEFNNNFKMILDKTDDGLKSTIKEDLKYNKPILTVNKISTNTVNNRITKVVNIEYLKFIKTFESFSLPLNEAISVNIEESYIKDWKINIEDLEDLLLDLSDRTIGNVGIKVNKPINDIRVLKSVNGKVRLGELKTLPELIIIGYVSMTESQLDSAIEKLRTKLLKKDIVITSDSTKTHSKTNAEMDRWFCCLRLMTQEDAEYKENRYKGE